MSSLKMSGLKCYQSLAYCTKIAKTRKHHSFINTRFETRGTITR